MSRRRLMASSVIVSAGALSALPLMATGVAGASPAPRTVYVSPDHSCGQNAFSSISAAVAAVAPHGTVVVCHGAYNEDVIVSKPVTLIGRNAVINPSSPVVQTNSPLYSQAGNNGITVAAAGVSVDGFSVTGASGDGIFSFADHSTITNNKSDGNAQTGISLNGSSRSLVANNTTSDNALGGITLTNDAGMFIPGATASHDVIADNVARDNPEGCGVILADHLGATMPGALGIFDNLVTGNKARPQRIRRGRYRFRLRRDPGVASPRRFGLQQPGGRQRGLPKRAGWGGHPQPRSRSELRRQCDHR